MVLLPKEAFSEESAVGLDRDTVFFVVDMVIDVVMTDLFSFNRASNSCR